MLARRSARLIAAPALCGAAGFLAAFVALPALAGQTAKTVVTVTAGSPTEQSVRLSKSSFITAGPVEFDS